MWLWLAQIGGGLYWFEALFCIGSPPLKEGRGMLGARRGGLLDRPFCVGTPTVPVSGCHLPAPEFGAGFQTERWDSSFPLKHRRLRACSGHGREGALSLTLQINSLPALAVASDLQGSGV